MTAVQDLSTGWEPGVAVEDTLLRRYLFHHAALDAAFATSGGGRVLDTDDLSMADLGRPGGYFNATVLLAPPADWDATMERVERFISDGRGTTSLWSAWPTPDLRLRGWRLSGHPPLLIRPPLSMLPVAFPAGSELDVRRVVAATDLAAWERAAIEGYPLPELQDAPVGAFASPALLDDERLHFFLGRAGADPVAAGVSFTAHGIASLALGATVPAARRRGLWRRLAVERLHAAPELWTAGVFSDLSRPSAERLGFIPLTRLTLWTRERS
jgi:hypothetical protein